MMFNGCIYGFNYLCFEKKLYKGTIIKFDNIEPICENTDCSGNKIYANLLLDNNKYCHILINDNESNNTLSNKNIETYNGLTVGHKYMVSVIKGKCRLTRSMYYLKYTLAGIVSLLMSLCFLSLTAYAYFIEKYKKIHGENIVEIPNTNIYNEVSIITV